MEEMYVYIDETGDVGLTNRSRPYFIMCATVATKKVSEEIDRILSTIKENLNWNKSAELKFSKTKKDIALLSLKSIQNLNFKIYYVVYNKKTPLNLKKGESVYNTIMLALLKNVNAKVLNITVDGGFGRKYTRKTRTFTRKNLPEKTIKKFTYADSASSNNLQLVDLVAGSISRSISAKTNDDKFFRIVREKTTKIKL